MSISRRTILEAGRPPCPWPRFTGISAAAAQERQFRHALTLFDDIKYGPDFKNFAYVNADAPKRRAGPTWRQLDPLTA